MLTEDSLWLEVVAAIIGTPERILACQRRVDSPHPLRWELPGGKVETAESPEQALQRELREELGIEATVGQLVGMVERQRQSPPSLRIRFFEVRLWSGSLQHDHFNALQWGSARELLELDLLEADREILERLAASLG